MTNKNFHQIMRDAGLKTMVVWVHPDDMVDVLNYCSGLLHERFVNEVERSEALLRGIKREMQND